jgi:hypothetical protein
MISIEAGLLTFILTFYSEKMLQKGGNSITFSILEFSPPFLNKHLIRVPLFEIMILLIVLSLFFFTFSFWFSHFALDIHATAHAAAENEKDEEACAKYIESYARQGVICFKLGIGLLLAFVLAVLCQIIIVWFESVYWSIFLLLIYVGLYLVFVVFMLRKRPIRIK